MTKVQSEKIKDPFDDLFDELDEENLEDVDKGFEQLYENKKTMAEEDNISPILDVGGQVLEVEVICLLTLYGFLELVFKIPNKDKSKVLFNRNQT